MIGKTLSHFQIVDRLGEGGMGIVYRAEDTELQRVVALKVLQPEHVGDAERSARFMREAQTAAKVTHPNIATIYEVGTAGDNIFIAMELVEGVSLRERLQEGPIAAAETIELATQVADGMASAHKAGVIHRDLKPDNIMIDEEGRAKILDFGLAKAYESSDEVGRDDVTLTNMLTREGRIIGTAAYMSPEQARGLPLDARSDIFSLGIILYEMVVGRRPFNGETTTDILASILREVPTPPVQLNPQIPPEMGRIISKCLEKKPGERYQDSRDLVVDLRRMLKDPTTLSFISDPSLLTDPARLATFLSDGSVVSGDPVTSGEAAVAGSNPSLLASQMSASGESAAMADSSKGSSKQRLLVGGGILVGLFAILASILQSNGPPNAGPTNNKIAVMMFQNLKDPGDAERLGQILQELVITELSDIQGLNVFSAQRLFDVHQQLSESDKPIYDPEVATEVAVEAGAGSMIQGKLSQLGETWILTAQLVDVTTGTVHGSQRIDGDDLYAMVDELGHNLRDDLSHTIEQYAATIPPAPEPPSVAGRDGSVRERTTSSLDAYRAYLVGNDLLEQQEFHMAADTLKKAVELDPTFGQAYYKLAMALWWPGDNYDAAGEVLEELLSRKLYSTRKERLLAEAALELIQGDDKTKAIALYTQITDQFPDDKDGWYGYGEALFHNSPRLGEQALDAFRNATRLDPSFGLAYRHILDIQWDEGQFAESIEEIQPLLMALPQSSLAHEYWVGAATRWGDSDEIDRSLAAVRTLEIDQDHRQRVLVQAANGNLDRGDYRKAMEHLAEARELGSERLTKEWYMGMGQVLWKTDKVEELNELVIESVERYPGMDEMNQEGRIVVAMAEGDLDRVISLSTSVLEHSPNEVQPRIYMVASAASEEEWELVDRIVDETLASDLEAGQKSQFLHQIGQSVSDVGEFERARGYVDRAVALSPDRAEHSKNTIAWIDARCGRLDEAQDYYKQAMEEGKSSTAGYGLMYVAIRRQDYAEAVKIGQQLLDSGPETANLMRYMATAFAEQKMFREALPYAERAVAMDDGYASQSILAWTLVAGDIDVERGAEIADETADGRLHPEESRWKFAEFPSPEHSLGLALLKSDEVEAAVEVLEEALMRRPDRTLIAEDLRRAKEAL